MTDLFTKLAGADGKDVVQAGVGQPDNTARNRLLAAGGGAAATFLLAKYLMNVKHTPTLLGATAAGGLGGLTLHEMLAPDERAKEVEVDREKQTEQMAANLRNIGLLRPSPAGKLLQSGEFAGGATLGGFLAGRLTKSVGTGGRWDTVLHAIGGAPLIRRVGAHPGVVEVVSRLGGGVSAVLLDMLGRKLHTNYLLRNSGGLD